MGDVSTGRGTESAITEAILAIVADRGLDRATVREVAAVAGVAIGTVQHHFPTKDAMLVGAFTEVVARVGARLRALESSNDVRRDLWAVLEQILPVDRERTQEARVQLAFATRAMHEPTLAAIQTGVLTELHDAMSTTLSVVGTMPPERARLAAHGLIALADGLALHALSTRDWIAASQLPLSMDLLLKALTDGPPGLGAAQAP